MGIRTTLLRRAVPVVLAATGLALIATAGSANANPTGGTRPAGYTAPTANTPGEAAPGHQHARYRHHAPTGSAVLFAVLSGANEVPAADPDGIGLALVRIDRDYRRLCYVLTVENIATPTAAHIHQAPAGSNGPVVVDLGVPPLGLSSRCVRVSYSLGKAIARHPHRYYVNVHTADYPDGAIRGQLG